MNAILHRMEAAALTRRFVLLLASKRRLFALTDAIRGFGSLVAKMRGEVTRAGDERARACTMRKSPNSKPF